MAGGLGPQRKGSGAGVRRRRSSWGRPVFLVVLVFLALYALNQARSPVGRAGLAWRWAIRPVQGVLATAGGGLRGGVGDVLGLFSLAGENRRLAGEVAALTKLRLQVDMLSAQNRELTGLLHFKGSVGLTGAVGALVIGRDSTSWFQTVTIDRGRRAGIRSGEAVVASGGVVGRVTAALADQATVLLLSDPESEVGAVVGSGGYPAVLGGGGDGNLRLTLFQREAAVRAGDAVTTSGLGGVFPRGLPLGRVVSVSQRDFGLEEFAVVKPAVDLDRLNGVLVLRPGQ